MPPAAFYTLYDVLYGGWLFYFLWSFLFFFGIPLQKYMKKCSHSNCNCILGRFGKEFGKKRLFLAYFPGKDWEELRAFLKSSPVSVYLGRANGLMSSALRSSVTLLSTTYPSGSSAMTRLHASALLLARWMACRRFFSMMSGVNRCVQKNDVSVGSISSAVTCSASGCGVLLGERWSMWLPTI